MQSLETIRKANPKLAETIEQRGYFLFEDDIPKVVEIDRFIKCLVKCGNGRFTCSVQDVQHFVTLIQNSKVEYVRSVELALT